MIKIIGYNFYITICIFVFAMYVIDDKFIYISAAFCMSAFFAYKFRKFSNFQISAFFLLTITIIFQFLILNKLPYDKHLQIHWVNILKLLVVTLPLFSYIKFYNEITIAPLNILKPNQDSEENLYSFNQIKENSKELATALGEITLDLPRHSSFRYINYYSLDDNYFKFAKKCLDDESIYLLLSHTGSNASKVISKITKSNYNHISIAFDYDLVTTISFNNGNELFRPGLNFESIQYFNQTEDANIMVYRLPCTSHQKQSIIHMIHDINANGNSYNLLGLVTPLSTRENIMYCSQFVYKVLHEAGLQYFPPQAKIKPQDFIEKDYHRKLEFCYDIFFKEDKL